MEGAGFMSSLLIFLPAVVGAVVAFVLNILFSKSGEIKFKPRQAFLARIEESIDLIEKRRWKREYAIDYFHHSLENHVLNVEFLVLNTSSIPKVAIDISANFDKCSGYQLYEVSSFEDGIESEKNFLKNETKEIIEYITVKPGEAKIIKCIIFLGKDKIEDSSIANKKTFYIEYTNPRTNFLKIEKKKKFRFELDEYITNGEFDET